jgi:Flp pilus assembly pilin Flp
MNLQAIRTIARKFTADRRGAAVTEYVIIVGLIAMIALGVYKAFGQKIAEKVTDQTNKIQGI